MRPAPREAKRCIAVVIWHCKHFTAAEMGERLGAGKNSWPHAALDGGSQANKAHPVTLLASGWLQISAGLASGRAGESAGSLPFVSARCLPCSLLCSASSPSIIAISPSISIDSIPSFSSAPCRDCALASFSTPPACLHLSCFSPVACRRPGARVNAEQRARSHCFSSTYVRATPTPLPPPPPHIRPIDCSSRLPPRSLLIPRPSTTSCRVCSTLPLATALHHRPAFHTKSGSTRARLWWVFRDKDGPIITTAHDATLKERYFFVIS